MTGIVTGTPTGADQAASPITLTAGAFDGARFRTGIVTFTEGNNTNNAPVVDMPIGPQMVDVGAALNLDVSGNFSDPDGDALTFSENGANLPASLTLSAAGVISGTPLAGEEGDYTVTVRATDPGSLFVEDTFTLTVDAANQAPVVDTPIGNQTATENVALMLDVSGSFSDPDMDALVFSETGLPASLSINGAGVISGTPVAADVGDHTVEVTATDPGTLTAMDTFTLTVEAANQGPVLDMAIGARNATQDVPTSIDVSGNFSDPEGDPLTFAAAGLPASLGINATTGVILGTPVAADVGTVNVTVTVTDAVSGGMAMDTFALTINPPGNAGPVLDNAIGAQSATEGTAFSLDVSGNFSDPEGDPLAFSATGLPASLTIDSATGIISGTPVAADVGSPSITVTATDAVSGGAAMDTFTLTIDAAPPPPPAAPAASASAPTGRWWWWWIHRPG